MEIEFANDELKDLISDPEKLKEKFGEDVAHKIGQAIHALSEAETLADIDTLLEDSEQPEDEEPEQYSVRISGKSRQTSVAATGATSTSLYH